MGSAWLYPLILFAGAMQAWGPPITNALRNGIDNPWLASAISFLPAVMVLAIIFLAQPRPLPTAETIATLPRWAPQGGVPVVPR